MRNSKNPTRRLEFGNRVIGNIVERPVEGEMRVWNVINPPNEPDRYPVNNPAHAYMLIQALAETQLLVADVYSNAFGLEVYRDGEWEEWNDDEGRELDEHIEEIRALYPCHKCGATPLVTSEMITALYPILHFANMFQQKPLGGTADEFYGIHQGTEWAASLKISEFCKIRHIVLKGDFLQAAAKQLKKPVKRATAKKA